MQHIRVADLMTDEVVAVAPGTRLTDVAMLLARHDISGVPVLDEEDRVLGVVSRTDLPACAAPVARPDRRNGTPPSPPSAGALMSTPAVTVRAEETAADAARLMARRGVERLPVVDVEDRLVGILTRRDLLRLFVRPDSEIHRRVRDVLGDVVGVPAGDVEVHVVDGVVALEGTVPRASQLRFLQALAERVDGVVAVASHVTARTDDTAITRAGSARQAMPW